MPSSPPSSNMAPLPTTQLIILALVIFTEPVALTVLYPFMYFMVKDFNLTTDNRQLGYYVGILAASFSLAQFTTSLQWGWVSDRIGRKPVILIGLVSTFITALTFGLSQSFTTAILSRSIGGFFNGNIAVAKSMLGEITDDSNRSIAFSLLGLSTGLGLMLAPTLGGLLADPAAKYPFIFGSSPFFKKFKYFLPCLVTSSISLAGIVSSLFFLRETLKLSRRNQPANAFGAEYDVLSSASSRSPRDNRMDRGLEDVVVLKSDDQQATLTQLPSPIILEQRLCVQQTNWNIAMRAIAAYGFICFVQIIYQEAYVLWATADLSYGGLGWNTSQVGYSLASSGIVLCFFQMLIYPVLERRRGAWRCYRDGMALNVPLMFVTGFMDFLRPSNNGIWGGWLWIVTVIHHLFRVGAQTMAFTSSNLMINNSVPASKLGTVNGLGQALASFVRGVGPLLGGAIWSMSISSATSHEFPFNYQFVFVFLAGVSILGFLWVLLIPISLDRAPVDSDGNESSDSDAGSHFSHSEFDNSTETHSPRSHFPTE